MMIGKRIRNAQFKNMEFLELASLVGNHHA